MTGAAHRSAGERQSVRLRAARKKLPISASAFIIVRRPHQVFSRQSKFSSVT